MRSLLFIFFACIFPLNYGLAQNGVQGSGAQTSDRVLVEKVTFHGDNENAEAIARAAVDIPIGQWLPREDLDNAVSRAEQRLRLQGYFHSVDVRLERGSAPSRFTIVVTLESESFNYFGVAGGLRHYRAKGDDRAPTYNKNSNFDLFGGTRNLYGTRAQLDIDAKYQMQDYYDESRYGNSHGTSRGSSLYTTLNIPELFGSPLYLSSSYIYSRTFNKSKSVYGFNESTTSAGESSYSFIFNGFLQVVGARFGLLTASAGVFRIFGKFKSQYSSERTADPLFSYEFNDESKFGLNVTYLQLQYSEKTGQVVIEPGLLSRFSYVRQLGDEVKLPEIMSTNEYSYLFAGHHAVTPKIIGRWTREEEFTRDYDLSLRYEFATPWEWVLGIEEGLSRHYLETASNHDSEYPKYRTALSAKYYSPTFIASLAFIYGELGLSSEDFDLSHLSDSLRAPQ